MSEDKSVTIVAPDDYYCNVDVSMNNDAIIKYVVSKYEQQIFALDKQLKQQRVELKSQIAAAEKKLENKLRAVGTTVLKHETVKQGLAFFKAIGTTATVTATVSNTKLNLDDPEFNVRVSFSLESAGRQKVAFNYDLVQTLQQHDLQELVQQQQQLQQAMCANNEASANLREQLTRLPSIERFAVAQLVEKILPGDARGQEIKSAIESGLQEQIFSKLPELPQLPALTAAKQKPKPAKRRTAK